MSGMSADALPATSTSEKKLILVTGYFDRGNLGDDLFKEVWQHIFNKDRVTKALQTLQTSHTFSIIFETVDDLEVTDIGAIADNSLAVIIVAGGDVLNYYFLTQLQQFIRRVAFTGILCAFSVGIPYTIAIADGLLDSFDFIGCRAKTDAMALYERLGAKRTYWFPDISVYLKEMTLLAGDSSADKVTSFRSMMRANLPSTHSIVGVFLARTIQKNNPDCEKVVQGIARSLDLISRELPCRIYLLAFNTYTKSRDEDDRVINHDVARHTQGDVYVCDDRFTVQEMYAVFKTIDLAITMRYHSHMYAIVAGTPLVSIEITPTVRNLLEDSGLQRYSYRPPLNESGVPKDFESEQFKDKAILAFYE